MADRSLAYMPVDDIKGAPVNPKGHDLPLIERSMDRFGYTAPIEIDERTGLLVSGHGRVETLQARKQAGQPPPDGVRVDGDQWLVPVVRGWASKNDDEAAAYLVTANRTPEAGGWIDDLLAATLQTIAETPLGLEGVGYTTDDLAELLIHVQAHDRHVPADVDPDEVPPEPAEPVTKLGDVWLLGPHRAVCGDSTDGAAVSDARRADSIEMVWADPPYGIGYETMRAGDTVENDGSPETAGGVLRSALTHVADVAAHFVCCDWRSLGWMLEAMEAAGVRAKACIVWDKLVRVQNLDRFAKRHEFILYAGPYGGEPTVDTDVWCIGRDFVPDHPTPKPVELIGRAIRYSTRPGALIFDPFMGSGSSVVAAHQEGRRAIGIELLPRYVDVACVRWQRLTGEQPVLESTGEPHDFLAELVALPD